MLCKRPFLRLPNGVTKTQATLSRDMRLAAIPFGCGQCLPCRINKAREWTHRILLEAALHKENAFITLTYTPQFLPAGGNLCKRDLQLFLKRFRRRKNGFRYFAVGEYGFDGLRPHYHIVAFNFSMLEQRLVALAWSQKVDGVRVQMGRIHLGEVNKDSARYITGYCTEKLTRAGDKKLLELGKEVPEFMTSSKQEGGIGFPAVKKIADQIKDNPFISKETVIRQIGHGNKDLPLGRYLTEKLAKELGSKDALSIDSDKHQFEILEKYTKEGTIYCNNIIEEVEPKAHSAEVKHRIFKKRKRL